MIVGEKNTYGSLEKKRLYFGSTPPTPQQLQIKGFIGIPYSENAIILVDPL